MLGTHGQGLWLQIIGKYEQIWVLMYIFLGKHGPPGILAGGRYHEDHHDGRSIIDAIGNNEMTFSNSNKNRFRQTVESLINAAIKSIYSGEHST